MKTTAGYIRRFAMIILCAGFSSAGSAQCSITASANNLTADTVVICPGNLLNLNSTGGCAVNLMDNNFNNGSIGSGWSSNAAPMFNNPCVTGPDGSTCLWIGPASNFPRELVTVPYTVTTACTICFDMIYSVQGVSTPCEGPDLPMEGVHLQWSTNGGASWTDIQYWGPNGGHDPYLTSWHNYCANVPVSGTNVQFRWYQSNTSGNDYDHWGIDNVMITCPATENLWWTGPNGYTYNNYDPPAFMPTQNGWYAVHLSDGSTTADDSVYVYINPVVSATITPSNPTLCYGQAVTTISASGSGGTPPYTYIWNTGATTSSITGGAGTYTVIVDDATSCPPASASATIISNPVPITANAGADQNLCSTNPTIHLTGSVTAATGGLWTGGAGLFVPSNTSLNATYYPTSSEINIGQVVLVLQTTGNGLCPADYDTVTVNFVTFQGSVTVAPTSVSCFGGNNGSATAQVTGGAAPFQYYWNTNPSQSGQTANGLGTGAYSVTVTDAYGCTQSSSATISQPQPLTAIAVTTNVLCDGNSNGTASVTAYGGTPGYYYLWSNNSVMASASGLSAGIYTVTITDALGCTVQTSATVASPPTLSLTPGTISNVSCHGGSNGSASVVTAGGTPGYVYSWSSGGSTSQSATGLVAGFYGVTVTDANGCTASAILQVTEPPVMSANVSVNPVTCFGSSDGSASVTVLGGLPGYMYAWSPSGGNGSTATGLIAGFYTVTITDQSGCQLVRMTQVLQPPQIITNGSSTNVTCFGGNNGIASVTVSGGSPGYSYLWFPGGSTSPVVTGLSAGNYTVTITDNSGCTATENVFLTQPVTALSATFTQTNANCFGAQNGSITVNPGGGTAPYTYYWQPGGSTSNTVTNLTAGSYFVTITDALNCSFTQSVAITQPGGILLAVNTIDATCGSSNGQASVIPSGGTPPYTYQWLPGGSLTSSVSNAPSGIYEVTVTDNSGCTQNAYVLVNDATGPQANIVSMTNVTCFGGNDGSATVVASGGTPPYTYSWWPYGGNNATANGLGAGTFIVQISDANGCQGMTLTNPQITQPPVITISSNQINVSCNGAANGSVNLGVVGGSPPYTYSWAPGGSTLPNLIGLSPGIYQVTVTDSKGCDEQYFINITQPPVLTASIVNFQNVGCFGGNNGSATVLPSGGTPPYSYTWSPSSATSQTALNLIAGTNSVFIVDHNGCSYSASVFLTQPSPVILTSGFTIPTCYNASDGTGWVSAVGGIPPYQYVWSPAGGLNDTATGLHAGVYHITVTDQNSCQAYLPLMIPQPTAVTASIFNHSDVSCFGGSDGEALVSVTGGTPPYTYLWSTGSTIPAITGLSGGTYSVTVTDAKGCSGSDTILIETPAQDLAISLSVQNISCYQFMDGSITANVSGGTQPYYYVWVPASQFTQTAVNLISGTYTVSVTDAHGCQITGTTTISQPQLLEASAYTVSPVTCFGENSGICQASAIGGVPPYAYSWNTLPAQTTAMADSVYAGNYTVTITDSNGCTDTAGVEVLQPELLNAYVLSFSPVSCLNGSNGVATASMTGGTPPFTCTWNTLPAQTGLSATGLSAGTWIATVTDNAGCQDTAIVHLENPTGVVTHISGDQVICMNDSTLLSASANGGAGSYIYLWNNGLGFGSSVWVSPPGQTDYIVTAYDQNGCGGLPDTMTVYVIGDPENLTVTAQSPICPGAQSILQADATQGMFDVLSYTWSPSVGTGPGPFTVTPVQETTYYVTVTNSCGATATDSVHIYFAPPPIVYFLSTPTQGCAPLLVTFTDSSFSSFDDVTQWTWSFGDGTFSNEQNPVHLYNHPGTYMVTLDIGTSGGCVAGSDSLPYGIQVFPTPDADFTVNSTTLNLPGDPAVFTNTSTGATAYTWDFGDGATSIQTNPVHIYTELGSYLVLLEAVSNNGCTDTATIMIYTESDVVFPNVFTPDDQPNPDGSYDPLAVDNHMFFPYATGVTSFFMQVYNRWGELVFETNDIHVAWDGYYRDQPCQMDVYIYKARVELINGRVIEKTGDITLLR